MCMVNGCGVKVGVTVTAAAAVVLVPQCGQASAWRQGCPKMQHSQRVLDVSCLTW